jgi:putative DNA primase/helicase
MEDADMEESIKIKEETQQRNSSQFSVLPDELKPYNHWVVWRFETRSGKQTKIPVDPKNGYNAASNQPESWATYEEAVDFYEACADCAGIGFMFSPDDPFVGIDLDNCRSPETNAMEPWAQEIIDQLNSYTDISPSGTGLHILIKGELPAGGRRKGQMEMYSTGRYFTITGNHLAGAPSTIEDRNQELQTLHARIFKKEAAEPVQEAETPEDMNLSDEDLIAKARNAANGDKFQRLWQGDFEGYATHSEADLALCSMLAFWTGGDQVRIDRLFRQSGLMRPKWDEPRSADAKTYGQMTIERAIANLPESVGSAKGSPDYTQEISEILQMLPQLESRKEKLQHLAKLVPMLANISHLEAEAVLADLEENLGISDRNIKILKADLKNARKQNPTAAEVQAPETTTTVTAYFEGLVDIVEHQGNTAFLVIEDSGLKILSQVKRGDDTFLPPAFKQIPWMMPRGEEVVKRFSEQESIADLYDDIKAYHQGISELPGETYYDLLTAWDFHTYLQEHIQHSPIMYFFAVAERGKSRTGKGMIYIAHRGLHVESLREAYLARVASNFQAAIFFDVIDIWKKASRANTTDILLHRFEKGATVPRVLHPDRGPFADTVYYKVFGPTIIATNETSPEVLESRAVQINMPLSRRNFETDVTPELGRPLKERLTAFRARYLGTSLPEAPKSVSGRLGDILRPLVQVIRLVRPEREAALINLIEALQKQKRSRQGETLEGLIFSALIGLEGKVSGGRLSVQDITAAYNQDKSEKFQINEKIVGRRLAAMGFQKTPIGKGNSAIFWNDELINMLCSYYGISRGSEVFD